MIKKILAIMACIFIIMISVYSQTTSGQVTTTTGASDIVKLVFSNWGIDDEVFLQWNYEKEKPEVKVYPNSESGRKDWTSEFKGDDRIYDEDVKLIQSLLAAKSPAELTQKISEVTKSGRASINGKTITQAQANQILFGSQTAPLTIQEAYDLNFRTGVSKFNSRQYDEAIEFYKKALKIRDDPGVYPYIGVSYRGKEDYATAMEYHKKAIDRGIDAKANLEHDFNKYLEQVRATQDPEQKKQKYALALSYVNLIPNLDPAINNEITKGSAGAVGPATTKQGDGVPLGQGGGAAIITDIPSVDVQIGATTSKFTLTIKPGNIGGNAYDRFYTGADGRIIYFNGDNPVGFRSVGGSVDRLFDAETKKSHPDLQALTKSLAEAKAKQQAPAGKPAVELSVPSGAGTIPATDNNLIEALKELGYADLSTPEKIGAAVKDFQSKNKDEQNNPLTSDGKVGEKTAKAINKALLAKRAAAPPSGAAQAPIQEWPNPLLKGLDKKQLESNGVNDKIAQQYRAINSEITTEGIVELYAGENKVDPDDYDAYIRGIGIDKNDYAKMAQLENEFGDDFAAVAMNVAEENTEDGIRELRKYVTREELINLKNKDSDAVQEYIDKKKAEYDLKQERDRQRREKEAEKDKQRQPQGIETSAELKGVLSQLQVKVGGKDGIANPTSGTIYYSFEGANKGTALTEAEYLSLASRFPELKNQFKAVKPGHVMIFDASAKSYQELQANIRGIRLPPSAPGQVVGAAQPPGEQPDFSSNVLTVDTAQNAVITSITISKPDKDGIRTLTKKDGTAETSFAYDARLLNPEEIDKDNWDGSSNKIPLKEGKATLQLIPNVDMPGGGKLAQISILTSEDKDTIIERSFLHIAQGREYISTIKNAKGLENNPSSSEAQMTLETIWRDSAGNEIGRKTEVYKPGVNKVIESGPKARFYHAADYSKIESVDLNVRDDRGMLRSIKMNGAEYAKMPGDEFVKDDALREAAKLGITSVTSNNFDSSPAAETDDKKKFSKIGSKDDYVLLANGKITAVMGGKAVKQMTDQGKTIIIYSGKNTPPKQDANGFWSDTVLAEESVARTVKRDASGNDYVAAISVRLPKGSAFDETNTLVTDPTYANYELGSDGRATLTMSAVRDGEAHQIIKISGIQHDPTLLIPGSPNYGKPPKKFGDDGKLTELTDNQKSAWNTFHDKYAEGRNFLTRGQWDSQKFFAALDDILGKSAPTGRFLSDTYSYFLGDDVMKEWMKVMEKNSALGIVLEQDLFESKLCELAKIDLPPSDEGFVFTATPDGYPNIGAFIKATKQPYTAVDDQGKNVDKYLYLISFKINMAETNPPTAKKTVGVNIGLRSKNLLQRPLLLNENDKFTELQRNMQYGSPSMKPNEPNPAPIIFADTLDYDEACILFDDVPFYTGGNLKGIEKYYALCTAFREVGDKAKSIEEEKAEKTRQEAKAAPQDTKVNSRYSGGI